MNTRTRINYLSKQIIDAAMTVHKELGPGLLESVYEACLCRELELRGIPFERQVPLPIEYKGLRLGVGYRMDIVVEDLIIVEVKSVEELVSIHESQLLTYLRLYNRWLGLLINFNVVLLKNGIKRLVYGYEP
jgi:GxxExxY protein